MDQTCTMLDKKLKFYTKVEQMNIVIRSIVNILTLNLMNFFGLQFGLLLFTNNYSFARNMFFIPILVNFGLYAYLAFFVKGERRPKEANKAIPTETKKNEEKPSSDLGDSELTKKEN